MSRVSRARGLGTYDGLEHIRYNSSQLEERDKKRDFARDAWRLHKVGVRAARLPVFVVNRDWILGVEATQDIK